MYRPRYSLILILAAALWMGGTVKVYAERVALVIGNALYDNVSNLPNAAHDAQDIAAELRRIGFNVTEKYNLDYRAMRLTLRDFSEQMAGAEMVLVYFAGHGIEIDNTNYLIPVNAELRSDKDVEFEAIRLDTMLNAVSTAQGLKLVLVDACRNNPFLTNMVRTTATRSIGQGLGRIDPGGVLVGYSARSGTLALDGEGRNSPYAEALLEHIEVPGLELGKMFRKVRDTVFDLTDGYQEPFTYGSLPGRDFFLVPAAVEGPVAGIAQSPNTAAQPQEDRAISAQRILQEALRMEDEAARKGALAMIAQLFPDTSAGKYAKEVAAALRIESQQTTPPPPPGPEAKVPVKPEQETDQAAIVAEPKKPGQDVETALKLSRTDYRNIQLGLNALGYQAGPADGIFGPRSRAALKGFQAKTGVARTGYLTAQSYAALKKAVPAQPSAQSQPQTRGQSAPSLSGTTVGESGANAYFGDYVIDIRRRPDPLGAEAGTRTETMLWLKYRKSAAGFQLISAVDRSSGGEARSKKYRASLSDSGRLRISGRTNYLFGKTRVVPFSISIDLPPDMSSSKRIRSTEGRFDPAYYVDVVVSKQ